MAVVEAHGGTIDVRSEPGQGSTFRITLPVDRSDVSTGAPANAVDVGRVSAADEHAPSRTAMTTGAMFGEPLTDPS
jgi:hypothetical protein